MIFKSNKNEWGNTSIFPSIMGVSDFTNPIKEFFSPQQRFGEEDIAAIKRYNEEFDRLKAKISGNNGLSDATKNVIAAKKANKIAMEDASDAAKKFVEEFGAAPAELDKLTKSSKAAELAMKGLALAGNILVSLVISKVISTIYEMSQASDTVGKAAKEAADELITQRQNSVQFRMGEYKQNCGATLFKSRIFRH